MNVARHRQRGISLLDALIAVALLAALATLLTPSLYGALRTSASVLRSAHTNEARRIVEETLTQILSNAVTLSRDDKDLLIKGDSKSFRAISLAGGGIARRFSLSIDNGKLLGEVAPLIESTAPPQQTEILAAGALRFSYYGRATDKAPLVWSDRWDSVYPPQIIRFEMTQDEPNSETTIFDTAVQARGPLHCAFDPVSRRCRN